MSGISHDPQSSSTVVAAAVTEDTAEWDLYCGLTHREAVEYFSIMLAAKDQFAAVAIGTIVHQSMGCFGTDTLTFPQMEVNKKKAKAIVMAWREANPRQPGL